MREEVFVLKWILVVKTEEVPSWPCLTQRKIRKYLDECMSLLFYDSFTSQVITSSDLLPPPPLTLAGVTSGTVQETKEKLHQGAVPHRS